MPYLKRSFEFDFDTRRVWELLRWRGYVLQLHRRFLSPGYHKERIGTFKPHWLVQVGPLVIGGEW